MQRQNATELENQNKSKVEIDEKPLSKNNLKKNSKLYSTDELELTILSIENESFKKKLLTLLKKTSI